MRIQDYDKYYAVATIIGAAITFIEVYYRCYGMFSEFGAVNIYLDTAIAGIKAEGLLSDSYIVKSVSFLTVCLPMLAKTGRGTKIPYGGIFIAGLAGMVLFFLPYYWDMQYCLTSVSGLFISAYAFAKGYVQAMRVSRERQVFHQPAYNLQVQGKVPPRLDKHQCLQGDNRTRHSGCREIIFSI